jgi:hypothetical protein
MFSSPLSNEVKLAIRDSVFSQDSLTDEPGGRQNREWQDDRRFLYFSNATVR